MSPVRVADVERAISARFPLERAEQWDRCGLLVGDPVAVVSGVVLALDPTEAVVERAAQLGCNVVVTHHPAFLTPPAWLTPGRGGAGVAFAAFSRNIALINAHTNLDRDARAQALIPRALGLTALNGLERALQPMSVVTVYAPREAVDRIVDAMAGAGAGRVGDYDRCAFSAPGTGRFTAPEDARPAVGKAGAATRADEERIEMVCPAARARSVVAAATAAHPYEEPLVVAKECDIARSTARLGMVCATSESTTLGELARAASKAYRCVPRVWGDPEAVIERVATATGSAGSLVGEVIASGAHALVAGEVRYHDALEAVAAGVCVIELGHDVTEWPLVELLEEAVRSIAELPAGSVHRLPSDRGWWTPETVEGDT